MIEITAQSEAPPATYPAVIGVSGDALDTAWQRIEHYVSWRFSARLVVWRVDSSGGEWSPPLRPVSGDLAAGVWNGAGFVPVTLAPAPGGFRIPPGRYEITAVVGAGPVPVCVEMAVKRLADYLAAKSALPAGLRSYSVSAGEVSVTASGDPATLARALQNSGAADLLRPYRRA